MGRCHDYHWHLHCASVAGDPGSNHTFLEGEQKVRAHIDAGQVRLDKTSTNTTGPQPQSVSFLGVTTALQRLNLSWWEEHLNLSDASINIFVEVGVGNTLTLLANNIPVPQGSSFVISDVSIRQFFRAPNKLEFIVIPQMPLMLI